MLKRILWLNKSIKAQRSTDVNICVKFFVTLKHKPGFRGQRFTASKLSADCPFLGASVFLFQFSQHCFNEWRPLASKWGGLYGFSFVEFVAALTSLTTLLCACLPSHITAFAVRKLHFVILWSCRSAIYHSALLMSINESLVSINKGH